MIQNNTERPVQLVDYSKPSQRKGIDGLVSQFNTRQLFPQQFSVQK